ncbi:MAG: DUF3500 domain-containing protein, partial [Verrucomicrobiota bacterium]
MMRFYCFLLIGTLGFVGISRGENYPSLPSQVLSNYVPQSSETTDAQVMAAAGQAFLSSLSEKLHSQAALPYDSKEKQIWTNTPPRGPQGGVRLGDLNEKQIQKACDLLATVLSEQGYGKARNIPLADDRLLKNGERRPGFGAEDYWLAIFGTPSATEPWALQFDGHHLAINLAFRGEQMSMSPTFIGTQPRDFQLSDDLVEPMVGKDSAALELLRSLDDKQRSKAVIGDRRNNLKAGAGRDGKVPAVEGVACGDFTEAQKEKLMAVLALYVDDMPKPFAEARLEALRQGVGALYFA